DFKKKYNTYPSYYGAQSYDAIMLIAALPSTASPRASFHRALFIVGILGGGDGGGDGLHRHHAGGVLDRFLDVEVLDRELVGVVLEVAAQRFEVGLLELGAHLVLVREIALQRFGRGGNQHD